MRTFAMLMILGGIFITGLSVWMLSAGGPDSASNVINIIDIGVGIVMIFLGTAFLAGRRK